jgi:hypothetical protein
MHPEACAGLLDASGVTTDNFRKVTTRRPIAHLEAQHVEAFEQAGTSRPRITVREEERAHVRGRLPERPPPPVDSDARFERLRDRVDALGGRLTMGSAPGRELRMRGSHPLAR